MAVIEQETVYTETPIVTTRDVLHRAADLLEEFGWCQHSLARDKRGEGMAFGQATVHDSRWVSFCARGAIERAEGELGFPKHVAWPQPISAWNNAPGRTKAEVVAKLREAAEAA